MRKIIFISLLLLFCSTAHAAVVDFITLTKNAAWVPRVLFGITTTASSGELGTNIWLTGGNYGGGDPNVNKEVWKSFNGVDWLAVTKNAGFGNRYGHVLLVFDAGYGDRLRMIGGMSGTTYINNDYSSADGYTWTVNNTAPWAGRYLPGATVMNGKVYVFGGRLSHSPNVYANDVWSTSDMVNWVLETAAAPWTARSAFGFTEYNGYTYIAGGIDGIGPNGAASDVWRSNDGANWELVGNSVPTDGTIRSITLISHQGYLYSNFYCAGGPNPTDTYNYSLNGDTWTSINRSEITQRQNISFASYNDKLLAIGGQVPASPPLKDVYMGIDGPTSTPVDTVLPTMTVSLTQTNTYTSTKTATPTVTKTITPTWTLTMTLTPTRTVTTEVFVSLTPTETITPTITITNTYTVTATITPTAVDTATPGATATVTPIHTPFIMHIASESDGYKTAVLLQWELYPEALDPHYVLSYGDALQYQEFLTNDFSISASANRFVYPLYGLKSSANYNVQLLVMIATPALNMYSNTITVSPVYTPTP